ncbi:hydrolase [Cnuibacter physcomitrellae]|uniref:Beta-N-acetylhexosaminidase n=1 Tax=Cnuibacter physcomitrellae TaxID=1619308 RepID=A0A1X9LRY4_9MICO|nr:beta-N-acetylhexosaminidase [Cnuibacter physcomitrellae]ARJ04680.1 beta-N-acetylhexosaminidase [Cnuibacter physcomitrellae]GGI42143.1 hydrolase [Cnuibacter physcomitrellae]
MNERTVLGTLLPGFEGSVLPDWVERMLREGLAGVCLFGENIVSPEQLRTLTRSIRAANPAAVIAIDEEGGDVTRLYYDRGAPFPGNAVLGRLDDVEATWAVGASVGAELAAVGIDLDLAPDVDVNSNALNPVIGIRSFGADPELVARHSVAWVQGLQSQGVAACVKHFPGHGDTAQDSHLALPTITASTELLRTRELLPFAASIDAGAAAVMSSHIVVSSVDDGVPATFSVPILQGILRVELGFRGVVVSDALDMAGASGDIGIPDAAVRALAAGCDLLCIGTRNSEEQMRAVARTIGEAVSTGRLEAIRVTDAADRVAALRRATDARATTAATDAVLDHERAPGGLAPEALTAAFRLPPDLRETLAAHDDWVVVRHEAIPNVAVGDVPWGPFDALAAADPRLAPVDAAAWSTGEIELDARAGVLFIGRDNARRPEARDMLARLRAEHPAVVAIDMGWPAEDDSAQIATFGGSAAVGEALAGFLVAAMGGSDRRTDS